MTNRARALGVVVATLMTGAFAIWAVRALAGSPPLMVSGVVAEGGPGAIVVIAYTLSTLVLTILGVVITSRVGRNPIGWILLGLGVWGGLTFFLGALVLWIGSDPSRQSLAQFSDWIGYWTFVPSVAGPVTFVLMLAPDGRLPSRRWKILPWLAAIGIAGWTADEAFSPQLGLAAGSPPNPYPNTIAASAAEIAGYFLAPALVGSVLAAVMRFRRAGPQARQQVKWVMFGGTLEVLITIGLWIWSAIWPTTFGLEAVGIGTVAGLITPTAFTVAILRFRLYEIDRLIHRTVTYGLTVGIVAAAYALVTIGVPQLLDLPGDTPVLVALATLTSFILFRPAAVRIQAAIERRFNRRRYDAEREVEGFTTELAHRVELAEVLNVTTSLLNRTMQPTDVGVWVRGSA